MKKETEERLSLLEEKRINLLKQKVDEEFKMQKIKNLIRTSGTMPCTKYKACVESQHGHMRKINTILVLLREVNTEIKAINRDNYTNAIA